MKNSRPAAEKRPLRGRISLFGLCLLLCASLITGCGILPKEEELPTAPILVEGETEEYILTKVNRGDVILTDVVRTRFMPSAYESLSFPIGGERIRKVYVALGDRVQPGDLLMEVDTDSIQNSIRNQQNTIDNLELSLTHLEEARGDEIYAAYLEDQQARRAGVSGWISRETIVEEQYDHQIQQTEAALEIARLRLEELEKELAKRQLRASIEGNVAQIYDFSAGERVEKDYPVIRITNMDEAVFEITSNNENVLKAGQTYELEINQSYYQVKAVSGRDLSLPSASDNRLYLQLLEPGDEIAQGTTGTIRVPVKESDNTLFVNLKAVQSVQGKPVVYVLNEDGFREIRYVEIGLMTDTVVELLSGVEEGDDVILP